MFADGRLKPERISIERPRAFAIPGNTVSAVEATEAEHSFFEIYLI